jgi:hypothetical protein
VGSVLPYQVRGAWRFNLELAATVVDRLRPWALAGVVLFVVGSLLALYRFSRE